MKNAQYIFVILAVVFRCCASPSGDDMNVLCYPDIDALKAKFAPKDGRLSSAEATIIETKTAVIVLPEVYTGVFLQEASVWAKTSQGIYLDSCIHGLPVEFHTPSGECLTFVYRSGGVGRQLQPSFGILYDATLSGVTDRMYPPSKFSTVDSLKKWSKSISSKSRIREFARGKQRILVIQSPHPQSGTRIAAYDVNLKGEPTLLAYKQSIQGQVTISKTQFCIKILSKSTNEKRTIFCLFWR